MFGASLFSLVLLAAAPASLTWDQALELASGTPAAQALREAASSRKPLDDSIGGLSNPELSLSPGVRNNQGRSSFAGEIGISQGIPLSDRAGAGRAAARSETALLEGEARTRTLAARTEAATAFCALEGAESSLAFTTEEERLAAELLARIEEGAAAGIFTAADVAEGRAYLAEARLARTAVEGEVFERGLDLAAAVRLPQTAPVSTSGGLPTVELPPPAERERLLARTKSLPPAQLAALQASTFRAQLAESEAFAVPELGVGAAVVQDEAQDRAIFATLRFALPLFQRNQRARAQLAAATRAAEGEQAEAELSSGRLAAFALHEVEHTGETLSLLENELLPSSREAVRLLELALGSGEVTVLDLIRARRALAQAEARQRRAAAEHAASRARLSLLLDALQGA